MKVGGAIDQIAEQGRNLECRVEASGLYRQELVDFTAAVVAYEQLLAPLGVAEDLGTLTTPESRNLVRDVQLADGTRAVLKIIGHTREPGEGLVLEAWRRLGLPCVEPLAWGYDRVEVDGRRAVAGHVLTRYCAGTPWDPRSGTLVERVAELVEWFPRFHLTPAPVGAARTWEQRLAPHLEQVLPLLRAEGLREPPRWQEVLSELSAAGRSLVHGDVAGPNVLVTDGGLVLLDPVGALVAMPEADWGQAAWHLGGVDGLPAAVEAICDAAPALLPGAVAAFAGFNLILAAGYELANHAALGRRLDDVDRSERLALAQELLDGAGALIGRFG